MARAKAEMRNHLKNPRMILNFLQGTMFFAVGGKQFAIGKERFEKY